MNIKNHTWNRYLSITLAVIGALIIVFGALNLLDQSFRIDHPIEVS